MIKEYFAKNPQDYEIIMTEGKGHASKIASHFSIKDNVTLYSVGGDGTAYEVLNGINDHVCMAIIPAGTGNDYYRNLEVPEKSLHKILIETIVCQCPGDELRGGCKFYGACYNKLLSNRTFCNTIKRYAVCT